MSFLEAGMIAEIPIWNKSNAEVNNRFKSLYLGGTATNNKNEISGEGQKEEAKSMVDISDKKSLSPGQKPEKKKVTGLMLISLKNKINILEDLYQIGNKNEEFKDHQVLKFRFMLTAAKLLTITFSGLYANLVHKKKNALAPGEVDDFVNTDIFKKLITFCEQ